MKHKISALILSFLLVAEPLLASQQTNLGTVTATKASIGSTSAPTASSILDTVSTAKGTRPCPSMTQAQRDAIASPAEGLCVDNTTTHKLNRYNASTTSWQEMGGGSGGIYAGGTNLLTNNSWETDSSSWTSTGTGTGCSGSTAYARTTTAGQYSPPGVGGACFDSAAAGETLTASSTTITNGDGISGANGAGACWIKAASGTATHLLEVFDGTNVLSSVTVTSSTSQFVPVTVPNFTFPASGTVTLRLKSVASNEPVVYLDDCYLGKSANFNQSQVSQASLYGTIKITGCSTNWIPPSASTGYADFSTQTGCSFSTTGSLSAPATNIPGFVMTPPPGDYLIMATGAAGIASAGNASQGVFFQFYDGTNGMDENYQFNAGNTYYVTSNIVGRITYSTAPGSVSVRVRTKSDGTTNYAGLYGTNSYPLYIKVYRFPTSSEAAYRSNQVPAMWSGYHDSTCAWNITSTTYADGSNDASCTFTETANVNFGTVTSSGSKTSGIVFTPPTTGKYNVSVNVQVFTSASNYGSYCLTSDGGTTCIATCEAFNESGSRACPLNGILSVTSTASVTLKVMGKAPSTKTASIGVGLAEHTIDWRIEQTSPSISTPVFYGGAQGTITNDNAAAGYIGEYKEAKNSSNTACASSGTYTDANSLSLTAGDWDVTFLAGFIPQGSTTFTYATIGISTTSGNSSTGLNVGENQLMGFMNTVSNSPYFGVVIPAYRMSLASTTTVYGKVMCNFTTSGTNPAFTYRLSARRVR